MPAGCSPVKAPASAGCGPLSPGAGDSLVSEAELGKKTAG